MWFVSFLLIRCSCAIYVHVCIFFYIQECCFRSNFRIGNVHASWCSSEGLSVLVDFSCSISKNFPCGISEHALQKIPLYLDWGGFDLISISPIFGGVGGLYLESLCFLPFLDELWIALFVSYLNLRERLPPILTVLLLHWGRASESGPVSKRQELTVIPVY